MAEFRKFYIKGVKGSKTIDELRVDDIFIYTEDDDDDGESHGLYKCTKTCYLNEEGKRAVEVIPVREDYECK